MWQIKMSGDNYALPTIHYFVKYSITDEMRVSQHFKSVLVGPLGKSWPTKDTQTSSTESLIVIVTHLPESAYLPNTDSFKPL